MPQLRRNSSEAATPHRSLSTPLTIQALGGGDGKVSAAFRDRLNRAVRAQVPGLGGVGLDRGSGGDRPKPPKPRPQEELYPEPTTFTGPEAIELLPGQRKSFHMQCNAVDGFVPDRGKINVIAGVGSPPVQFGRGDLRRGRLQVSLLVAAEAPLGKSEQGEVEPGAVDQSWGGGEPRSLSRRR